MSKLLTTRTRQQNFRCIWCGEIMWLPGVESAASFAKAHSFTQKDVKANWRATKEHLVPRSHGGGMAHNIAAAHSFCNFERANNTHAKYPDETVLLQLPLEVQKHIRKIFE